MFLPSDVYDNYKKIGEGLMDPFMEMDEVTAPFLKWLRGLPA